MAFLCTDLPYCYHPCLRLLTSPSHSRSFTTTLFRRKQGGLPQFAPTSSPDLDTLLSTFRTNVFLPSHLIRAQQNLLYKPKNHSLLTSDEPATVKIGNEVLQLHPLNHLRDEPPTRQSFAKILDLMKEGRDWQNLPGFLEGLNSAKRKLHAWQIEKLVRRANMAGRQGVVFECLRRVESTGVGLWDLAVVREAMWGAVMKAQQGNWEKDAVEKTAKYARDLWDLMEDPRHVVKARDVSAENLPKARPEIVGVLLLLEAAKTLLSGKGATAEVQNATQLLLSAWHNTPLNLSNNTATWFDSNAALLIWAPVWHGMTIARKVLGQESKYGKLLREKITEVEPALERAKEAVAGSGAMEKEGGRRGVRVWEELGKVSF